MKKTKCLFLFCHDRLATLKYSVYTIFKNTDIVFDQIVIFNDGSNFETSKYIFDLSNYLSATYSDSNVMVEYYPRNQGIAVVFKKAFNLAMFYSPDYLFWLESDYIWREHWAEDAISILEFSPYTIMIRGTSLPSPRVESLSDFETMVFDSFFGSDELVDLRSNYYFKPFSLGGLFKVQASTFSTATMLFNWSNFSRIMKESDFEQKVLYRSFSRNESPHIFDDGCFSAGVCKYFYTVFKSIDESKDFPLLDVCENVLGNHLSGGVSTLNARFVGEGLTHASSPGWKGNRTDKLVFLAPEFDDLNWNKQVAMLRTQLSDKYHLVEDDHDAVRLFLYPIGAIDFKERATEQLRFERQLIFTDWMGGKLPPKIVHVLNQFAGLIFTDKTKMQLFDDSGGHAIPVYSCGDFIDDDIIEFTDISPFIEKYNFISDSNLELF